MTSGAPSPHESLYFEYQSHAALRKGDWKIVRERVDQPWQLFNLREDERESRDLAGEKTDRVKALLAEFRKWRSTFPKNE